KHRGNGGRSAVSTSTPTSSITGWPASSKASTLAPSNRHCSSPAFTGSRGDPPTKAEHTSVPPLMEASHRSFLTCSYTHWKPSGGKGEPVDPMPLSLLRSYVRLGSIPAFMQVAI